MRYFILCIFSILFLSGFLLPSFRCQEPDDTNFEFEFVEFDDGQVIQFAGGNAEGDYLAKEGDVLTFIVKVRNSGESIARNVNITFSVDGELKKSNTLRSVNPDEDGSVIKTVIFSWIAVSGEHEIMVEIDPNNDFKEVNEGENNDPNKAIVTIQIDEEISLPCLSLIWVPLSLMALAMSVLIFSKRVRSK